jgi:hypothetical protein
MLKNVFIFGINGNMGKRYATILKYLEVDVYGVDLGYGNLADLDKCDGVIIATPTDTHVGHMESLFDVYSLPVLCEKPFTKSEPQLQKFIDEHEAFYADKITMVNQYSFLVPSASVGTSFYNYFKTGNDGLLWDCINVIGIAETMPDLKTTSPIWKCQINGHRLNIQDMDRAYLEMIRNWVHEPTKTNWYYMKKAHEKIFAHIRNTGE